MSKKVDPTTGREKAAALKEAQQRKETNRTRALITGVVVVVLLLVVGVGAVIQNARSSVPDDAAVPANVTDGAVRVGQADAPVTVTVYEDFQCPACKEFEQQVGPMLAELREAGEVVVEYKPIAILDRFSSDEYSTRSLAAAGCVIDAAADPAEAFLTFHAALFAEQPAENGPGLPDSRLATLATTAVGDGDEALTSCITGGGFQGWAATVTDQASQDDVTGTPTVLVDGEPLESPTAASLQQAVEAAT